MNLKQSTSLSISMIVIGDEILNGRTADLNGTWLTKFLFKMGMELKSMRFIQDQTDEINEALTSALKESDIVITSGGIGPTIDDKTKNTLATYFQKKIIERDDIAQIVTENYNRFGRPWTKETNHYHFFPEDFFGINNPFGLAPGIGHQTADKKLILSAPGVPREFTSMVEHEFFPIIKKMYADKLKENFQTVIRTQGIPEEKIFFELCPTLWKDLEKFGKVSSLPHTIGIDIVVSYHGDLNRYTETNLKIKNLILQTKLAPYVWQWGNKSLNQLVLEKAWEKKCTFSFAESCTGGLTSSKITDLPGASSAFYGTVICYDNSVKENVLKVKKETLQNFGAVSVETAKEMAKGVRDLLKTDFAISISGIAGPGGGTTEKPVGTVVIGFASKTKNEAYQFWFPGDRIKLKDRFSEKALLSLLELISEN